MKIHKKNKPCRIWRSASALLPAAVPPALPRHCGVCLAMICLAGCASGDGFDDGRPEYVEGQFIADLISGRGSEVEIDATPRPPLVIPDDLSRLPAPVNAADRGGGTNALPGGQNQNQSQSRSLVSRDLVLPPPDLRAPVPSPDTGESPQAGQSRGEVQ